MKSVNVNYKRKVAKMMFIVVITFMICRLPFTALIFYRNQLLKRDRISSMPQVQNQVEGAYHTLWFASRYLIVVNAAVNPIIYGLTSEKFRKAFIVTTVGKWLFVHDTSQTTDTRIKKKQKQNTAATTTNKIRIFSIFKGKLQMNRNIQNIETATTDSGSNVRIIK
ncbi:hypothetical protein ILUMI_14379 [Ignelater luminosus]|uniref:G-protein coupled receptors family 1 profile domain-containing protein n=1 Tax=Ignelater luminosus TaxID=2038154 RepID=A0A8K0GA24_IGNLU|nr:hypothetical protein ILUMI_16458 [Ignelater luminosus]KAF2891794.1 hypothetical protein ILUMI_14379 [Ignelater luminosus]